MSFTETEVTEDLDRRGLLDAARRPGLYTLQLQTPSRDARAVEDRWHAHFDAMPRSLAGRLAACDRLLYAGSHGKNVYTRLCQHARGHQTASIMAVWPPERVVDVTPRESPGDREWMYAQKQAGDKTRVWTDGECL